ncbi:MAG: hypothetical protein WCO19_03935 [Candidatus Saccharibacteria bacterium]
MGKTKSRALQFSDFKTSWYQRWATELKQDDDHLDGFMLQSNKFWQNAAIVQVLYEHNLLEEGISGLGFGVGNERLPALLAKYNVNVTATDQDYRKTKALHWSKGELATGLKSLNKYGICDDSQLKKYVSYVPADMKKIPRSFSEKYGFVWSNCALGHLGSIEDGLKFIKNSLSCLKPGGWAIHTTETNVLSNDETVTSGDTVIFRLHDLHQLFLELTEKGYYCVPLQYNLGSNPNDFRVSLLPEFGNDFSKILVHGHVATQVILMIQKPRKEPSLALKRLRKARLNAAYKQGLKSIQILTNHTVFTNLQSTSAKPVQTIKIIPLKKSVKVALKKNAATIVRIGYKNIGDQALFLLDGTPLGHQPILLATAGPQGRKSEFSTQSWAGSDKNRPSARFSKSDYAAPGQTFYFEFEISASKKAGAYQESFSIVHENVAWVENSDVTLDITVT